MTLTAEQEQRAEALERVARTLRQTNGLTAASTIPEDVYAHLRAIAEWIVTGPSSDTTASVDVDTYKCAGCGDEHDLGDAIETLMRVARRDVVVVTSNLRHIGFGDVADLLDDLVESTQFRVAMRDRFLAFQHLADQTITAGLEQLLRELHAMPDAEGDTPAP